MTPRAAARGSGTPRPTDVRDRGHRLDQILSDAEDAETYAAYSIDFAYSAIEEAEYAVLDAVLAREDADSAAQSVSG